MGTSTTLVKGWHDLGLDKVSPMVLMNSGAVVEVLFSYDLFITVLLEICPVPHFNFELN